MGDPQQSSIELLKEPIQENGQPTTKLCWRWIKYKSNNGDKKVEYTIPDKVMDTLEAASIDSQLSSSPMGDANDNDAPVKKVLYNDSETRLIGKYMTDKNNPLKARMRALFVLRNIAMPVALEVMNEGFADDSVIMKHEIAYCMGQTQLTEAIPYLKKVLQNLNEHQIVRHESVEALGAIGTKECANIVIDYLSDPAEVVRDSVKLALSRIAYVLQCKSKINKSHRLFFSVDPAFPLAYNNGISINKLEAVLLNSELDIYERYEAMFALRDVGSPEAIAALGKGLEGCAEENPLFKHEIAFVLGQLQNPLSEEALAKCLLNVRQDEMVRHECAEALGAIGTESAAEILKPLITCDNRIVRESVEIALDINEYEMSGNLEYCNGADIMKVAA